MLCQGSGCLVTYKGWGHFPPWTLVLRKNNLYYLETLLEEPPPDITSYSDLKLEQILVGLEFGTGIGDWDLEFGIGIGDGGQGIGIRDWDWGLGFGFGISYQD